MIKKEKNSAQSAAVIFGSTETTTPKTSADAILEAAEKSFFNVIYFFCLRVEIQAKRPPRPKHQPRPPTISRHVILGC